MSWAVTLEGEAAFEAGYRLHRLGLAGEGFEVTPGYLKAETELRRVARVRLPPPVAWASVAEALAAAEVPEGASSDRAWYRRRVEAGEGREVGAFAAKVTAIDTAWRPKVATGFLVSPAVRVMPCLARAPHEVCGGRPLVVVGPGLAESLGLLGAVALGVEAVVMDALPEALPAETRHFVVMMVAGSVLVRRGIDLAALDVLLADTTRVLLPPQHREGVLEKRVRALVKHDLVDQAPGEIERMIHGLARRRADRLLRAWQRGFFVPRGLDLAALEPGA